MKSPGSSVKWVNWRVPRRAKCLHINAWATRNWIGYTFYDTAWKTRLAFHLDYASGDSHQQRCGPGAGPILAITANT